MHTAIRRLGAIVVSGSQFASPFLTFLGAAWLFNERLTGLQWMGGIGVIIGSFVLLLITYAVVMSRLDAKHGYSEDEGADQ